MKHTIEYWKNELEEWSNFFYQFADELSNEELHQVCQRMQRIDGIIDRYDKPISLQEKNKKRKLMLQEAW